MAGARQRHLPSLDWPLSHEEKKRQAMHLYACELEHQEDELVSAKKEIKVLRRASLASAEEIKVLRRASLTSTRRASTGSTARLSTASTTTATTGESSTPDSSEVDNQIDAELEAELEGRPSALSPSASTPSMSAPDAAGPITAARPANLSASVVCTSHPLQRTSEAPPKSASSGRRSASPPPVTKDPHVAVENGADDEVQTDKAPLNARQRSLRDALRHFYKERQINGSEQATNLARMCGDSTSKVDETQLWAAISHKYGALPVQAVSYLAKTLGPLSLVQWQKDHVPDAAKRALGRILAEASAGGTINSQHEHELREALKAQDSDLLAALSFRGCPTPMRKDVWRVLLSGPRGRKRGPLQDRRAQYRKLRERSASVDLKGAASGLSESGKALLESARAEIDADIKGAWVDEAFLAQPGVVEAVSAIAFTTAARYGRYVRGSCEMASLLLFVMLDEGGLEKLADAEADAFWCLSQLMLDMRNSMVDSANQSKQAHHIQYLLRLYDPCLAELLRLAGIVALPTTRLGVALCTRAGFSLAGCARLWDAMLSDPKRFEFCNYIIVAALLLNRERLLDPGHDAAALAEEVLAAPRQLDIDTVLGFAYAICAFERRCGDSSPAPFPPRPGVLDVVIPSALEAVQTHVTSAWDKVRASGVGVWRAGRKVAASAAAKVAEAQAQRAAATQAGMSIRSAVDGDNLLYEAEEVLFD